MSEAAKRLSRMVEAAGVEPVRWDSSNAVMGWYFWS